jgi:hypothetical protein
MLPLMLRAHLTGAGTSATATDTNSSAAAASATVATESASTEDIEFEHFVKVLTHLNEQMDYQHARINLAERVVVIVAKNDVRLVPRQTNQ